MLAHKTELVPVYIADLPKFGEPIQNVTVPLGRDAVFSCTVDNLQTYKVIQLLQPAPNSVLNTANVLRYIVSIIYSQTCSGIGCGNVYLINFEFIHLLPSSQSYSGQVLIIYAIYISICKFWEFILAWKSNEVDIELWFLIHTQVCEWCEPHYLEMNSEDSSSSAGARQALRWAFVDVLLCVCGYLFWIIYLHK